MADTLTLEVVTPQKVLFETTTKYVTIPGIVGELGVLPGHLPIFTELGSGVLRYTEGPLTHKVAVHYGFAQVYQDKVTVLAKMAETGDEIDVERSKKSQLLSDDKLQKLTKSGDADIDAMNVLEAKLIRSLTRQSAAGKD